jgi:hypothetical protein
MPTRDAPTLAGPYELFEAIASGGTATVHLGRLVGLHGFSRPVAIKRLHAQLAEDRGGITELREEARLVSRIQHVNVVPVLDVVEDGDGLALVMDYVEGESLGSLVRATLQSRGEPPPIAVVSAVVAGALRGLHAAHEAKSNGEPLGIDARDTLGQSLNQVAVSVDGVPLVGRLDGSPTAVDPGPHRFRFERAGGETVEMGQVVRPKEISRSPSSSKPTRPLPRASHDRRRNRPARFRWLPLRTRRPSATRLAPMWRSRSREWRRRPSLASPRPARHGSNISKRNARPRVAWGIGLPSSACSR